ncbi:MAG: DUF2127 domain-containing protein [Patescibacteria group bacterium]|jgi:uncharacterized membrane protein
MADKLKSRNILHLIFEGGVIIKGIDGLLETIGGFLLLAISPKLIDFFTAWITLHELVEDPNDLVANWLVNALQTTTISAQIFAAVYLLIHGLAKIILAVSLLKEKVWAYPATVIFLLVFIFYQIYRFSYSYNLGFVILTFFDTLILVLTWREYKQVLHRRLS